MRLPERQSKPAPAGHGNSPEQSGVTKMEDKEFYFGWLSDLREEGSINMFAAPSLMAEEFGLRRQEARQIFVAWTESFEENQQ
jgi:hypothetical protein